MPNEIHFVIIGEADQGFKQLLIDPDDIHHVATEYGQISFDYCTDIHDYIRDRFDGTNPSLNPKVIGSAKDILATLQSDLEELKKGVPFEDLMDVCWLDRSKDYTPILEGIEKLIKELQEINTDPTQQIILYWW